MITFFTKLLQSFAISLIKDNFKKIIKFKPAFFPKAQYLKTLERTLAQMPFIYKDIDLEVLNDYVDIEVQFVDPKNLQAFHVIKTNEPLEKLNQNYKALFIGSAGMGKSTFFRFSTLSVIKKNEKYFLRTLKGQLPIFISLKSIPNFGKSPIITFLLTEVSFLRVDGLAKLESLTKKGKVFFLLDGYDEISFTNSKNHIQYELGILLSTTIEEAFDPDFINPDYFNIYSNITRCTVWLSTREEFYRLNPIGRKSNRIADRDFALANKDFIAVQLRGLGDNRLVLVKKIFDKYRIHSTLLKEALDEESFIEEIDTHEDSELVRLSKRPLFLTILCYIHVNYIIDHSGEERTWLPYLHDLILECIKVLLSDLDKFKVRQYTAEQKRIAFVNRRSGLTEEKTSFLKYFAFELMVSGLNTFDSEILEQHIRFYFNKRTDKEHSHKILAELDNPKSNNPNFVKQLLFSGIFVVVNSNQDHLLYDFPHRRFKEVLATEALKEVEMFEDFSKMLTNRELSEFVLIVFKELKNYRDAMMTKLFEGKQNKNERLYRSQLILNILHQNPSFKIDKFMLAYLKESIVHNKYVTIYEEMLMSIKGSFQTIQELLLSDINEIIKGRKIQSLSTLFELAEIVSSKTFQEYVNIQVGQRAKREIKAISLKFNFKNDLNSGLDFITLYRKYSDEVSLIAVSSIDDSRFNDSFYIDYFLNITLSNFIKFWHLLFLNNDAFAVKRKSSVYYNFELIYDHFVASRGFGSFKSLVSNFEDDIDNREKSLENLNKPSNKNDFNYAIKELSLLRYFIESIDAFTKDDWILTKEALKNYDRTDYTFLKNRVDKHKFYHAQTE